eukprot:4711412-Pleurochrysis_carterae.AAC.2
MGIGTVATCGRPGPYRRRASRCDTRTSFRQIRWSRSPAGDDSRRPRLIQGHLGATRPQNPSAASKVRAGRRVRRACAGMSPASWRSRFVQNPDEAYESTPGRDSGAIYELPTPVVGMISNLRTLGGGPSRSVVS